VETYYHMWILIQEPKRFGELQQVYTGIAFVFKAFLKNWKQTAINRVVFPKFRRGCEYSLTEKEDHK